MAGLPRYRPGRGFVASALIGDIREIAPTGWYGDLSGVSEEKGRALLAKVADAAGQHVVNVFGPKGTGYRADAPARRLEEWRRSLWRHMWARPLKDCGKTSPT